MSCPTLKNTSSSPASTYSLIVIPCWVFDMICLQHSGRWATEQWKSSLTHTLPSLLVHHKELIAMLNFSALKHIRRTKFQTSKHAVDLKYHRIYNSIIFCSWHHVCAILCVCLHVHVCVILCACVFAMFCMKMFVNFHIYIFCMLVYYWFV